MEETEVENQGEIHSNVAATNLIFATCQILKNGKHCEVYKLFIDFKKA